MSNLVIHVENLGKRYRIGERERYLALRDVIARAASAPGHLFRARKSPSPNGDPTHIWALQDVAFEVRRGEMVGIVGRNGAGKTTLLKILARVTKPTQGFVEVRGRMGSLLEVGTGFHPELTGRENVSLSGAILGMGKAEIQRKFDEIVAFAEVEKFIDTPLKHYSSGMQMRLAFAVAAHLEPEILLVDEVLAVGDQQFQKKCLGKMSDVAKGGRTILFVSHNMGAITRLCGHGIWLENGRVKSIGPVQDVAAAYIRTGSEANGERRWEESSATGNESVCLRAARILQSEGHVASVIDMREQFQIEIEYEIRNAVSHLRVCVRVAAADGTIVFTSSDDRNPRWDGCPRDPGKYVSRCSVPGNLLNEGRYTLTLSADTPFVKIFFFEENAIALDVERTSGGGTRYPERWPGLVCPELKWDVDPIDALSTAIGRPAGMD
jgi:lipopolysaccharide transport system ATP-binding protein